MPHHETRQPSQPPWSVSPNQKHKCPNNMVSHFWKVTWKVFSVIGRFSFTKSTKFYISTTMAGRTLVTSRFCLILDFIYIVHIVTLAMTKALLLFVAIWRPSQEGNQGLCKQTEALASGISFFFLLNHHKHLKWILYKEILVISLFSKKEIKKEGI